MNQKRHSMSVSSGLHPMMDKGERARRNLKAIASVLGRANRIITGEDISMVVAEKRLVSMDTPGWTDGKTIWLNGPNIRNKLANGTNQSELILALKGVNYHELAHVLHTPFMESEITQKVWREHNQNPHLNIWYSFNLLEDLRGEMLFVTEFPSASNYYTHTVTEWIMDNPANSLDSVWPLLSGRYYLPAQLRKSAKDAFAITYGKACADEVDDIARQYLRILYPQEIQKGWALIRRLYTLLFDLRNKVQGGQIYMVPPTGVHFDPEEVRKGNHLRGDQKSQARRQKRVTKDRDELLDELEKEAESVFNEPTPEPPEVEAEIIEEDDSDDDEATDAGVGFGDGDEEADEDADASNGGGSSDEQADEEADSSDGLGAQSGDESDTSSEGAGGEPGQNAETNDGEFSDDDDSGSTTQSGGDGVSDEPGDDILSQGEIREELLDAVKEAHNEALGSEDLQEDLKDVQESVRHEINKEIKRVDHAEGKYKDVSVAGSEKRSVSQMVRHLDDLRVDLEPVWRGQQPTGHLNIRDAMSAQSGDLDIFDVWEEGSEEEASTEIVILLDLSPSMDRIMPIASRAMWMLKRAFDEARITTTVLGYADNWSVLYQPHDKARKDMVRMFPYEGMGTTPDGALAQAKEILRGSRATNRILVSITDGVWRLTDEIRRAVLGIKSLPGGQTVMINIDGDNRGLQRVTEMKLGDHKLCYHQKGHYLGKIEHIVPIVEALVTDIMREVSSVNATRHV